MSEVRDDKRSKSWAQGNTTFKAQGGKKKLAKALREMINELWIKLEYNIL